MEIAKRLRDARRRHEQLGLSREEAAFYDALAGGVEDVKADPALAKIAHELVESIRTDLTVDWADRAATEAKIRAKIKRLLRKHKYRPPAPAGGGGDHGVDYAAQLVLDQAKALYATGRTWRSATGCSSDRIATDGHTSGASGWGASRPIGHLWPWHKGLGGRGSWIPSREKKVEQLFAEYLRRRQAIDGPAADSVSSDL